MSVPSEPTFEQRVTPLELFFDLVFVFAITRVTALMAHDLSWNSIGHGLLVLAALWWGWAAYAWLTNYVSGEDGPARLVVFVAMAAMVLVALAVP
jgi:low temperature requirement protein LtrA